MKNKHRETPCGQAKFFPHPKNCGKARLGGARSFGVPEDDGSRNGGSREMNESF
jgi:hypothetical protein